MEQARKYLTAEDFKAAVYKQTGEKTGPRKLDEKAMAELQAVVIAKACPVVKAVKAPDGSRSFVFAISDETVDRDGDTIAMAGWETDNYKKNPVVLFAHDQRAPSIAKSTRLFVEDGMLKSEDQFPDEGVYAFADTIYGLIAGGFLNATSVGMMGMEWTYVEESDRPWGIDFKRQELYEHSIVPVPANANALREGDKSAPDFSHLSPARIKSVNMQPLADWGEERLDEWEASKEGGILVPKSYVEALCKAANGNATVCDVCKDVEEDDASDDDTGDTPAVDDAGEGGETETATEDGDGTGPEGADTGADDEGDGEGESSDGETAGSDADAGADDESKGACGCCNTEAASGSCKIARKARPWNPDSEWAKAGGDLREKEANKDFLHHHCEDDGSQGAVNMTGCIMAVEACLGGRESNATQEVRMEIYAHVSDHLVKDFGMDPEALPAKKFVGMAVLAEMPEVFTFDADSCTLVVKSEEDRNAEFAKGQMKAATELLESVEAHKGLLDDDTRKNLETALAALKGSKESSDEATITLFDIEVEDAKESPAEGMVEVAIDGIETEDDLKAYLEQSAN